MSARKSTAVGIGAIGLFYVLTLFPGLGAMTSGTLDLGDSNMSAPLLARSFGELPFACISAIAFTTVLGTVGWAFNIAASANLPALIMLLFWELTTKQGITAAIATGMVSSLAWVLGSKEALQNVYGFRAADAAQHALVPFSQPAIVTVPLGFVVLIAVSLLTQRQETQTEQVQIAA